MDLEEKNEMEEAGANFEVAMKALEKAERELYLTITAKSSYWVDYAEEHRN